ncbi:EF-hand domain-containing protein [Porphyrobacter sp. LM 6]|uniref:EF-hand domain-containing protein n=1 Tax=Porphyrobacter sp. LM 6 TaxID=1896196 RepID=UPI0008467C60|nr:EF-hand domain-containing protein [Porphyrobacter sp. LM 6]
MIGIKAAAACKGQTRHMLAATRMVWLSLVLVLGTGGAVMSGELPDAQALARAAPNKPTTPEARRLAKVSPYADARRWETFLAVREVFRRNWLKPKSTAPFRQGQSSTFTQYPLLQVEDRDSDGKADFFAYLPPDGSDQTQEFGAFFDLDGNGQTDCVVVYGGLLFDARMEAILWHHYALDTDGDGKFDVRVFEAIDLGHDGLPDDGVTAWVYDTDHDGLIDKAEHIAKGNITAITPQADGRLDLGYILHTEPAEQPRIGGPVPTDFFEMVAREVDALLAR